jgi:indolepyruvate ferredoxin oxidoreductase
VTRQDISLNDRYDLTKSQVLLNGTQALVRLMLMQKARDVAVGLNTAGYVTGYRGSPLGAVDMQMDRAAKPLAEAGGYFSTRIERRPRCDGVVGDPTGRAAR